MTMVGTLRQPTKDYASYAEFTEGALADGWSDGLPLVPPTPERVESFLQVIRLIAVRGGG